MIFPLISSTPVYSGIEPLTVNTESDQFIAGLVLFALDCHLLTKTEYQVLKLDVEKLIGLISTRLSGRLNAVANQAVAGLIPFKSRFEYLEVVTGSDIMVETSNDYPLLVVTASNYLSIQIALDNLPLPVGVAVCVALNLMQRVFPMLIGRDILENNWFYYEMDDELVSLKKFCDPHDLDAAQLYDIISSNESLFPFLSGEIYCVEDSNTYLEYIKSIDKPFPEAVKQSNTLIQSLGDKPIDWQSLKCKFLATDTELPNLSNHPLMNWVERVLNTLPNWIAIDSLTPPYAEIYDSGCLTLETATLIGFGEDWEDDAMDNLLNHQAQIGEPMAIGFELSNVANLSIHENLILFSECVAMLSALTVLYNREELR